jgi:DNA-binding response OmpR family regulator
MSERKHVLIVHGNDAMAAIIETIVKDSGFEPVRVLSGNDALAKARALDVRTAVVDVAVSDPYAYELVPALKCDPGIFVVLLASVYDKTAYKRRPGSLYGADDYLEQHHLPDKLPMLLTSTTPQESVHQHGTSEADPTVLVRREALRRAADEQLGNGNRTIGPDSSAETLARSLVERARALASKLVLDISLYHDQAFMQGLVAGDLKTRLAKEIEEAKRFLGERLPESFKAGDAARFVDEALVQVERAQLERARTKKDDGGAR